MADLDIGRLAGGSVLLNGGAAGAAVSYQCRSTTQTVATAGLQAINRHLDDVEPVEALKAIATQPESVALRDAHPTREGAAPAIRTGL